MHEDGASEAGLSTGSMRSEPYAKASRSTAAPPIADWAALVTWPDATGAAVASILAGGEAKSL